MHGALRRATTASPLGRVTDSMVLPAGMDSDWAQSELSSYFKQHPEKLSNQLDRIMDKLRLSQGDMQGFIVELDTMITELNDNIDSERQAVEGRDRLMRDYPEVTNEFLHFFLDGIMEAMEKEQAGGSGSSPVALARGGMLSMSTSGPLRPGSGSSTGSASVKERFSNVSRRMQT